MPDEEPACYHNEDILEVVANKTSFDPVVRFLRGNKLFVESEADYAASLIILKRSKRWRIRADLNASRDLGNLPLIRRTGKSSPWMRSYMLGLEGEVVTDPDLQRAKCLFISSEAAVQEWIDLLIRVLRMVQMGAPFSSQEFSRIAGSIAAPNTERLNELTLMIERLVAAGSCGVQPNQMFRQNILQFLDNSHLCVGLGVSEYLDFRLNELGTLTPPEAPIPFDPYLLKNLLITLKLASCDEPFESRHLGKKRLNRISSAYNLVIQGAGDLSMNEWNLAFYHEPMRGSQVVIPENEPFGSRKYNCLVVWSDNHLQEVRRAVSHIAAKSLGISLGDDVSITQLQFAKGNPQVRLPEDYPSNTSLPEAVKFAVYGKLILREGEVIEPDEVIDEFQDLRHVFQLPNLNPANCDRVPRLNAQRIVEWIKHLREGPGDGYDQIRFVIDHLGGVEEEKETPLGLMELAGKIWQRSLIEGEQGGLHVALKGLTATLDPMGEFLMKHILELRDLFKRPRHLFGQPQSTDVWLLEHVLLDDRSLRHLACKSTIAVDLADLGAPQAWIDYCLLESGYRKCDKLHQVMDRGDFAWDDTDHPRLLIRLKLNTYPCTMVGLGKLSRDDSEGVLYLLAWGHDFRRGGHTVWDCARVMKAVGASYALVIDEGQDTFQCHIKGRLYQERRDFLDSEKKCKSVDRWMPVPLAFEVLKASDGSIVKTTEGSILKRLNRRSLRASLAFWQEDSTLESRST